MNLVFERSKGRFKSNCNVLALAWMPYYHEAKFRQALLEYHQRQLINSTNSVAIPNSSIQVNHGGQLVRARTNIRENHAISNRRSSSLTRNESFGRDQTNQDHESIENSDRISGQANRSEGPESFLNSRVAELHQRYLFAKDSRPMGVTNSRLLSNNISGQEMSRDLDDKYGRLSDFGWLAVGNVGKMVGVTLTSVISPPVEELKAHQQCKARDEDLMSFGDDKCGSQANNKNELADKLKKPNNFNEIRPDRSSVRSNYNLRGHLEEVILVKWNELYQKLATVDSKGNVLIWCKVNEKFIMQTPFYNRSKSVADFKWSNDGKTALICYTDSFILVGSSSSQRHWHSMLNLDDYHITCASWTPNDDQLLLGVSNGNVVVIDLPSSELTELVVNRTNIRTMCWSTCDISLANLNKFSKTSRQPNYPLMNMSNSVIVAKRRLSRDCSVFSKYRFCSQGPTDRYNPKKIISSIKSNKKSVQNDDHEVGRKNVLAIDFANNTIKLYNEGLNDPEPKTIVLDQESYIMHWSSNGKILAVAGFNIHTSAPSVGHLRCRYSNIIKFFDQKGSLICTHPLNYSRYPITAFTWAHDDKRIFVATGPEIHCAKVIYGVAPLTMLTMSCIQRLTRLPGKTEKLENILKSSFGSDIFYWQSHNCPIDIKKESKRFQDHKDDHLNQVTDKDQTENKICNNSNVYQYKLPYKLKNKIDELFTSTIREPFDSAWSLSDVAWHVPRDQRRFCCTLICYSCDQEIANPGCQYQTRPTDESPDDLASDHYKVFVLYLEFQGSLIPLLRARRVKFLKPEFVIFDPDDNQSKYAKPLKISDSSQTPIRANNQSKIQFDGIHTSNCESNPSTSNQIYSEFRHGSDNCESLHSLNSEPRGSGISLGKQSLSDAEHYYNFDCETKTKDRIQLINPDFNRVPDSLMAPEDYHLYMLLKEAFDVDINLDSCVSRKSSAINKKIKIIDRHKYRSDHLVDNKVLPQGKELLRIKSNIWGTKFRLINIANRIIRRRSLLGSIDYKASILHLQPRQIFLNIKDMSNYCCLCSRHHHNFKRTNQDVFNSNASEAMNKGDVCLLDVPNEDLSNILASKFSTPAKQSRSKNSTTLHSNEKIIVPVGDGIRVVPKLDYNQKYCYASSLKDRHNLSASRDLNMLNTQAAPKIYNNINSRSRSTLGHKDLSSSCSHNANPPTWMHPQPSSSKHPVVKYTRGKSVEQEQHDDDILTLRVGQNDKMEIHMSSPNVLSESNDSAQKLDEFLTSNKTLKSIQTITKMIVDLSSKADDEDFACRDQSSPKKMIKMSDDDLTVATSHYSFSKLIPPETPVHRPNRRISMSRKPTKQLLSKQNLTSQSVSSTPLRNFHAQGERQRDSSDLSKSYKLDNPLPPPPPSVPFGRKLSSSAKRFFDGSLRSLYNGVSGGYLSASEAETGDCELLVNKKPSVRKFRRGHSLDRHSQPCSPMRSNVQKQSSDLSNLKAQILQRLKVGRDISTSNANCRRKNSKPRRTHWSSSSGLNEFYSEAASLGYIQKKPHLNDDLTYRYGETIDSCCGSDSSSGLSDSEFEELESYKSFVNGPVNLLHGSQTTIRNKRSNFRNNDFLDKAILRSGSSNLSNSNRSNKDRRRPKRKSICPNPNCCCAKEFKLSNRPPIWNEQSQVYQLDFGGRVTQESAKNLQIDFDGNLALQFGRIDRCTYTLDYRYPFNAVQAMAVALASLTQRLK